MNKITVTVSPSEKSPLSAEGRTEVFILHY